MLKSRELIGDWIYTTKYARVVDGKKEKWGQSVDRVMEMHRKHLIEKLGGISNELESQIQYARFHYLNQTVLGAQRGLQFGGEQMFHHNMRLYNCFRQDTEFVTKEGVRSFKDFKDGDTVTVLTHRKNWKKAVVRNYGKGNVNKIHFKRGNNEFDVYATSDHRWIDSKGVVTDKLKEGDRMIRTPRYFSEFDYDSASPFEKLYWCYGMVYGDGTKIKDRGEYRYSMIRLCGYDSSFKERFEECGFKTSENLSLCGDVMAYTGKYLKTAPDPKKDSPELIRAFVAGYLQADGEKDRNPNAGSKFISIQSSELDHIEFIRECFPIAGVYIVSEQELTGQETNFGVRPYTISFRVTQGQGKLAPCFCVNKIDRDVEYTDLWCLEVEDDKSFMLKNGLATGNCSGSYVDRLEFFREVYYVLLAGAGAGFSVQKVHTNKLPKVKGIDNLNSEKYIAEDSIEGWAECAYKLIYAHYHNKPRPDFDLSNIRPKGAMISGGFKAPGPAPLRKCLNALDKVLSGAKGRKMRPFELHRMTCLIADSVISGGIRRSALISQFDADDMEMMSCKTGEWWSLYPELSRANNSVIILPTTPKEVYDNVFKYIKEFGEPGVIFLPNEYIVTNPCCEVSGYPTIKDQNGVDHSGWFLCNLTEINGSKIKTVEDFYSACEAASILGTIQASWTDFKVVDKWAKAIIERDALIGVGITGMCENPEILFDEEIQREGARIVKETNQKIAKMLGISPAARTTVIKPSGNSSQLLGCTSSGIHPFHFRRFIRHIQAANTEQAVEIFKSVNPQAVEVGHYNPENESVIAFPVELPENVMTRENLTTLEFLDLVRKTKLNWVNEGTNYDHPFYTNNPEMKDVTMNVSNTVTVKPDEWEAVREYVWEHRDVFAGISFLPEGGDLLYPQAPYASVIDEKELAERYGSGAILAGGLIVDGLKAFNNNLWIACDAAMGRNNTCLQFNKDVIKDYIDNNIDSNYHFLVDIDGVKVSDINAVISHMRSSVDKKNDWVRRFKKFSDNYLGGDLSQTENCLKHVSLFHKWNQVISMKQVDWNGVAWETELIDADQTSAQGCAGGACEIL